MPRRSSLTLTRGRRRRRGSLPRTLRRVALGLAFVLVIEIIYVLFNSPVFAMRTIRVEGNHSLRREDLVRQAGIAPGQNLFRIRTGRVQARLRELSAVAAVAVRRRLPSELVISVTERRPAAVVRAASGPVYLDAGGVAFRNPGLRPQGLPELAGVATSPSKKGGEQVQCLLKTAALLWKQAGVRAQRLALDESGRLTATLTSGTIVELGETVALEKKIMALAQALRQTAGRGPAEYIDVSSLRAAVWKPRRGEAKPR